MICPHLYLTMPVFIFDTIENLVRYELHSKLYTCIYGKFMQIQLMWTVLFFITAHGIFKEIMNLSLALENNNNGCCLRNGIFVWSLYNIVLILSTKQFLQMFQAKLHLINKRLENWKAWPYEKIARFEIRQYEIF